MCQFSQLECILTIENFTWQNYWGGGGHVPPVPPRFLRPCMISGKLPKSQHFNIWRLYDIDFAILCGLESSKPRTKSLYATTNVQGSKAVVAVLKSASKQIEQNGY